MSKKEKIRYFKLPITFLIIALGALLIFLYLFFTNAPGEMVAILLIAAMVSVFLAFITFLFKGLHYYDVVAEASRQQAILNIQKEKKEREAQWQNKQWDCPVLKLYTICANGGVTELSTEYSLNKATTVLQSLLNEAGAPRKYWDLYCDENSVRNYFDLGRKENMNEEEKAQRRAEEEALLKSTPQIGKLNDNQAAQMKLFKRAADQFGIQKRITILKDTQEKISKRISELIDSQLAMQQVGSLLNQSVYQERKKDWAVLGGMAEGIGGPIAGIGTALNAMQENEQIESRNQVRREAAAKTVSSIYSSSYSLSGSIESLEESLKPIYSQLSEATQKVVISTVSKDDLFAALDIKLTAKKASNEKSVIIEGSITNHFVPDVPEGVVFATDGALDVHVYYNDRFIDSIPLTLPLLGIACKEGCEKVITYSDRYVENQGNYSVEVSPRNLWLVEV